jgi:signal transduction histidine kinase
MVVALSLVYLRGRHKQMAALKESENRLRVLTSQLLTVQEKERRLVANELHDSIGSALSVIKFKVEDIIQQMERGVATPESLKDLIPTVQQTMEESRRIQTNLRPSLLDDLGILTTLDWHCREFQKTFSHIRIEKEIDISEDDVPHSLKTVIYRIFQEALNNIAKHSKADLITLSLRKTDGPIELTVQDNGHGFDVEEIFSMESYKKGLGLGSMRERTELSGGSFTIESVQGKGTTIHASWPAG